MILSEIYFIRLLSFSFTPISNDNNIMLPSRWQPSPEFKISRVN